MGRLLNIIRICLFCFLIVFVCAFNTDPEYNGHVNEMDFTNGCTQFCNLRQYKGTGKRIYGKNFKIAFNLIDDEIAICKSIPITINYRPIQVKADGEIIGKFTTHNPTVGESWQNFIEPREQLKFQPNQAATYQHEVDVDRKLFEGEIYDMGRKIQMPDKTDYMVIINFHKNG